MSLLLFFSGQYSTDTVIPGPWGSPLVRWRTSDGAAASVSIAALMGTTALSGVNAGGIAIS